MATHIEEQVPDWYRYIMDSLEEMKYGTIQITVHDGRIVQIDRTEKKRFDEQARARALPRKPNKI